MVADDHPIMRNELRDALDAEEDFEVVGQASDGDEAVRMAARVEPDVIVMDVMMPGKARQRLRQCSPPCPLIPSLRCGQAGINPGAMIAQGHQSRRGPTGPRSCTSTRESKGLRSTETELNLPYTSKANLKLKVLDLVQSGAAATAFWTSWPGRAISPRTHLLNTTHDPTSGLICECIASVPRLFATTTLCRESVECRSISYLREGGIGEETNRGLGVGV